MHTDTMDMAATAFGEIGSHHKEKLSGTDNREVSEHWSKLQDAVSKRQFLDFKDRQLPNSY